MVMFSQGMTVTSFQSKIKNDKKDKNNNVPQIYGTIMFKLYQCAKCRINDNNFVNTKVILNVLTKMKLYPKRIRQLFLFISLKKKDKKDFGCKDCFNLFVTDFLQCSLLLLYHENPSKNFQKPALNLQKLQNQALTFFKQENMHNKTQVRHEFKNTLSDKHLIYKKEMFEQQFMYFDSEKDLNRCENTVGIFWDIENCRLNNNHSAKKFLRNLKRKFQSKFQVKESIIVISCNLDKLASYVKEELFEMKDEVKIINHTGDDVNAADDRLMEEIADFTRRKKYLPSLTHLVVISGDGDFCSRLLSLKAQGYLIYNIHSENCSNELQKLAQTAISFEKLLEKC